MNFGERIFNEITRIRLILLQVKIFVWKIQEIKRHCVKEKNDWNFVSLKNNHITYTSLWIFQEVKF